MPSRVAQLPKKHMTVSEMQLVDKILRQPGGSVTQAHKTLKEARNKSKFAPLAFSSVYRYANGEHHKLGMKEKRGKKQILSKACKRMLEQAQKRMLKRADGDVRVTYKDIMEEANLASPPCERVVADFFRGIGVGYRAPRNKVFLSDKDIKTRLTAAKSWVKRPAKFWKEGVHCYLYNKAFVLPLTPEQRKKFRQTKVTGHLRKKSKGSKRGCVKPKQKHSFLGMPSVNISAAVAKDRVIMWSVNAKWGARPAAAMYSGPLKKALRRTWKGRNRFTIVEDGDRAGFQTKMGKKAKKEAGLTSMTLPPRTPAWMPLDYSIWKEIEKKVVSTAPLKGKESKAAYISRLQKCAKTLRKGVVANAIGGMRKRIKEVIDAKGFHGKHD
jgi:hypothetical protein